MKPLAEQNRAAQQTSEQLKLKAYQSAASLKDDIRRRIALRKKTNWFFNGMYTCRGILSLTFSRNRTGKVKFHDRAPCGCMC